jgi:hypothetical protein
MVNVLRSSTLAAVAFYFAAADASDTLARAPSIEATPLGHTNEVDFSTSADARPPAIAAKNTGIAVCEKIGAVIADRLKTTPCQWAIALFALILGCVMLFDGEFCIHWMMISAVFLFTYLFMLEEIQSLGGGNNVVVLQIAAVEIGIACAVIAQQGYEGIRLLIGLLIGAVFAQYFHELSTIASWGNNGWVVLVCTNLFMVLGVWMWMGKCHQKLAAVVSSIVGGALVASAVGFYMMFLCVQTGMFKDQLKIPDDANLVWVDFFMQLLARNEQGQSTWSDSAGFFQYKPLQLGGKRIPTDFILGLLLWLTMFFFGMWLQNRRAKNRSRRSSIDSLSEPLVEKAKKEKGTGCFNRGKKKPVEFSNTRGPEP